MDVVKEVFNDFYRFLNGTKAVGLIDLMKKYKEEPLFGILLSNIHLIADIRVNDAMKEAYGIYKSFARQELDENGVTKLYEDACAFEAKWKNLWCSQLITAVVAMLDPDREAAAALCREMEKKGENGQRVAADMEESQEQETCQEDGLSEQEELAA